MAAPPRIGLDGNVNNLEGSDMVSVYMSYVRALDMAGAVPLIVPPTTDRDVLPRVLDGLDGLVLTGGLDLPPEWYGQEPHPKTQLAHPLRLEGSRRLTEAALARGMPILGICMGCQLLSVALGGDLIQDVPSLVGTAVRHAPYESFHLARVEPGSRLAAILGRKEIEVNSSHHQAVGRPGQGLRAVAWAPDDIIEALEGEGDRFLLAIQWHPERLADRPEHLALFRALLEAARKRCFPC